MIVPESRNLARLTVSNQDSLSFLVAVRMLMSEVACELLTLAATRKVNMDDIVTKVLGSTHDAIAPDGSEVRFLSVMTRGGMAHFALGPRDVSKAVAHKTIEEIWYFIRGRGRMWRRLGGSEGEGLVVDVFPGVSITIPTGAQFQFRNDGDETLEAIGVTMPPWPGPDEAFPVKGIWESTVDSGN
jgi:mannose-6-phosphate isomerase-like protein (cupin superfamily)